MKQIINNFVETKDLAIAGASANPRKWGSMLQKELSKKGYKIYPVNPKYTEIDGIKCYSSVADLPDHVENLILATPPCATEEIVKDCKDSGIKRVWMHQGGGGKGAHSTSAIDFVKDNNMELIHGLCPMMFLHGKGIHKFHFWLKKISGSLPKELN